MPVPFAPEIATLRPVLPAAAAVEAEVKDRMLPLVSESAAMVWAVPVPEYVWVAVPVPEVMVKLLFADKVVAPLREMAPVPVANVPVPDIAKFPEAWL